MRGKKESLKKNINYIISSSLILPSVQPRNPNWPISAIIDLSKVSFLCKNML